MSGHLPDEAIEDYAMRRLAEGELPLVEEHLMVCPACQQKVEIVEALLSGLRQLAKDDDGEEVPESDH
jgi:hypothetical protein